MESLEILALFSGFTMMLVVPLATLLWTPVLAYLAHGYLRLKEREVRMQRLAVSSELRRGTTLSLPDYVDARDPAAVLAWIDASRELATGPISGT